MVACWSQLLFLFSSSRTMNTSKRPLPAWIPVLLQDPYLSLTVWPWGCWRMDSSVLSPSDSAPVAVAAPRGCPGGRGVPAVPLYLYTRGFVTSSRNKGPSFFPFLPSFPPLLLSLPSLSPLSPAGAGPGREGPPARGRRVRAGLALPQAAPWPWRRRRWRRSCPAAAERPGVRAAERLPSAAAARGGCGALGRGGKGPRPAREVASRCPSGPV